MTTMNEYALRIDANLLAIREFGPWLRHIVDGLGPDADPALASTLELSIHELLVNIVEHAYRCAGGVIEIDAHLEHDSIRFEIHTMRGTASTSRG